ncbi:sorting nexin-41 [Gautieria morchelliformis]|nr:sorting nexin-41 [Gautieria morchelliformis]
MDDFTEDTNPFHTDPDNVSNLTDESNVNPNLNKNSSDDQGQPPEPPELPSKRAYPTPRPQNQGGYKTALDRYLHSGEDVEIHIAEAVKTAEHSNTTYIAYVIKTGNFEARRRYSEFESLRNGLAKLYPTLIVPPIPSKQTIGDYAVKQGKAKEDVAMIARRKRMLQMFLNRIARHPILSHEQVFHKFLDGDSSWSEVLHSPPLSLLPRNILKAPAYNPTDATNPAYNALPNPSAAQPLRHPDQRFLDSEAFTNKFASHVGGPMEKVTRRTMKRWSELSADHADLGGILNGFSLSESGPLAASIEKTGQAIDATYMSTTRLAQEYEQMWAEPLHEYSQFASIIKKLLVYRHQKHVQYEMTQDAIETKKEQLEDLEKSEREARRLESALNRRSLNQESVLTGENSDTDGKDRGDVDEREHQSEDREQPAYASLHSSSPRRRGGGLGLLNALSYSLHGMMDVDPETARRNSITKTRESLSQLEDALHASAQDLKYASSTIQADLDRFQRQKVADLREMCINMARSHRDWCKKNLEAWEEVKKEVANIEEHPNQPSPKDAPEPLASASDATVGPTTPH